MKRQIAQPLLAIFILTICGGTHCLSIPTTNAIPSNLFLTDNGFLFWQRPSGERVVNIRDIKSAEKTSESRPANQYPEGNWGEVTNGFQLSLRFEKQIFTNGEPLIAITLMRNITNVEESYFFPVQIVVMKDGTILKRKGDLGLEQITMLPMKTVFPQTQIKYQENLNNDYTLSESGMYFFQAICHTPEVSSQKVAILITNNITN